MLIYTFRGRKYYLSVYGNLKSFEASNDRTLNDPVCAYTCNTCSYLFFLVLENSIYASRILKFILRPLRGRQSLLTECMNFSKEMDARATSLQTIFPGVFTFCLTATLPRHPCLISQQRFMR